MARGTGATGGGQNGFGHHAGESTMKVRHLGIAATCALALFTTALAGPREDNRVAASVVVLTDVMAMPDQRAPDWLLRRAYGIAVLPGVVKAGFGIGGRGGKGVLMIRDPQGHWTSPAFITLAGGSIGWQIGVQTSDLILVFTTKRSVEGLTGGKVTLGADASVAAGPVGRQASGATDLQLQSEVYSYSRTQGLFAGIAIDGSVISIDHKANAAYYARPGVLASDIFAMDAAHAPDGAQKLLAALRALPGANDGASAPAALQGAPPAPATAPPPNAPGLESSGATAYPLDPQSPPAPPTPHR
jgi:lipid-binding SYLF domain-containing protein